MRIRRTACSLDRNHYGKCRLYLMGKLAAVLIADSPVVIPNFLHSLIQLRANGL